VLEGQRGATTTSDAAGDFALQAPPGSYRLDAAVSGFAPVVVAVRVAGDVRVTLSLEPLDSPKLRQIGAATVDGRLSRLQGAIPSTTLTSADFERLGFDRIVEGLSEVPGVTFARPDGGPSSAVTAVALRGPDPSESLVALDGQLLNDGNTGDLDVSQLPSAAFSALDVSEGLGPEDSNGSNTFGGAIDLLSLRPTKDPHYALALSAGSFGQSEGSANATGSVGRLGYAVAYDDRNETGYVDRTLPVYSTTDPTCSPCATHLGSSIAAHTGLATATWTFSQNADVTARAFVLGDLRDQSAALNGIDLNGSDAGMPQYGNLTGPGNQTFAQTIRAYQVRSRAPLGAGELTSDFSESDNDVDVVGGATSPYDLTHRDLRYNAALAWQRTFANSEFTFGGWTRYESLTFEGPGSETAAPLTQAQAQPLLGQTIGVAFLRGGLEIAKNLRLDAGAFQSHYSTFGSNLDGRFGAIYDVAPDTTLRFSLGTGFRAPLLAERYQFPYNQLTLDGNNVFVGQGSPGEHPEHATEYELGASRELGKVTTLDVSVYQTNLRDPIEVFYPLAAVDAGTCKNNSYATPLAQCVSYNSNVGNAVYQGGEIRLVRRFVPQHLFLTAAYGLNVSYPKDLTAQFANPTFGGSLVNSEQFIGVPQQQGSLTLDWTNHQWHAASEATFRGNNNELAQGPFTVLDALVGARIGESADISLAATNIFNAVSGPFTVFGGGVPYRGIVGETATGPAYGALPTNAEFIEPLGFRVILTVRH
jgi:outer membrane receptor protein involved in Fe transport